MITVAEATTTTTFYLLDWRIPQDSFKMQRHGGASDESDLERSQVQRWPLAIEVCYRSGGGNDSDSERPEKVLWGVFLFLFLSPTIGYDINDHFFKVKALAIYPKSFSGKLWNIELWISLKDWKLTRWTTVRLGRENVKRGCRTAALSRLQSDFLSSSSPVSCDS